MSLDARSKHAPGDSARFLTVMRVVVLVLLVLAVCHPYSALMMKQFVNLFASGRSNVKTTLFLVYLLAVLVPFGRRCSPIPGWAVRGAYSLPLVLMGMIAIEHFWLASHLGMNAFERLDLYVDGELTSTSAVHMHEGKLVLSGLSGLFGDNVLFQYDSGYGLSMLFPRWLLIVQGVLVIAMLAAVLRVVLFTVRDPDVPAPVKCLLVVSAFSVMKNSVDGGALNPETLVSLPVFLACLKLSRPDRSTRRSRLVEMMFPAGVGLLLAGIFFVAIDEWLKISLLALFPLIAFYGVLVLVAESLSRRRTVLAVLAVVLPVFFIVNFHELTGRHTFASAILEYANRPLAAGQECVAWTRRQEVSDDENVVILSSTPAGFHQLIHFRVLEPMRMRDLESPALALNFFEVNRVGLDCSPDGQARLECVAVLPNRGEKIPRRHDVPGVASYSFIPRGGDHYTLRVVFEPCTPQLRAVLGNLFLELGIKMVVLEEFSFS